MRLAEQSNQSSQTKRMRRILATLILVAAAALIIWLFPNVLSGKEDAQVYVLKASSRTGGPTVDAAAMGEANSVMFSRLQQWDFPDFSLEQTGADQISVNITPEGGSDLDTEAVKQAVTLLCRPGQITLAFSESGSSLTNRDVTKAELLPEGENQLQTIQLQLSPTGKNLCRESEKRARDKAAKDNQPDVDPNALTITIDGDGDAYSSARLIQEDDYEQVSLTFHSQRQDAQDLALFFNSGSLPFEFSVE